MPSREKELKSNISSILVRTGLVLLALSFCAFVFFYYPVILKEISYLFSKPVTDKEVILNGSSDGKNNQKKVIVAADKEFSIVIPKIGANSKVIKNVDPYNSLEYQLKLTQGVAHSKGTSVPGEKGNSFYFAHSSDSFVNANRYNSVFYLLTKLAAGDPFYVIYEQKIYKYSVIESKVVSAEDISYLKGDESKETATLMTCWPAGTTLKRYVVVGELLEQ